MTPYEQAFANDPDPDDDAIYARFVAIAHAAAAYTANQGPIRPAQPATTPANTSVRPSEPSDGWVAVEPPSIYQAGFKHVVKREPSPVLSAVSYILLAALALIFWFVLRPQPGDPPSRETPGVEQSCNPYPDGC